LDSDEEAEAAEAILLQPPFTLRVEAAAAAGAEEESMPIYKLDQDEVKDGIAIGPGDMISYVKPGFVAKSSNVDCAFVVRIKPGEELPLLLSNNMQYLNLDASLTLRRKYDPDSGVMYRVDPKVTKDLGMFRLLEGQLSEKSIKDHPLYNTHKTTLDNLIKALT
jgi:hypothetical protein